MIVRVRPFARGLVPAATGEEAAAFNRDATSTFGVPERSFMESAGRAAAELVQRLHPRGDVVAVVGAGHNGGDALVALRTLAAWGRRVRAVVVGDRPESDPLLHGWNVHAVRDEHAGDAGWEMLATADVVLDGLLGTGARGAPRARQARAIQALNGVPAPVLSLDVPSGVDATTGAVEGEAVRAHLTIAFGWPKLGTLLGAGRALRGRLIAVEIGFPPLPDGHFGAALITPAWAATVRPRRDTDTHKYRVGTVLVVAGRPGMAGAAVLAARAALRAGAGLVYVASAPENRVVLQSAAPEAIFVDVSDDDALAERAEAVDAIAIGPGIGTDARAERVLAVVLDAGAQAVVLDADALTLLGSGRPRPLAAAVAGRPALLTPHVGEMERITQHGRDAIHARRAEVARATAAELGCTVLLKGLPSIVAAPDEPLLLDSVGTSDLATGGMGDVLTGTAGALLARGLGPRDAAALALHGTGRAAVRAGRGEGILPVDVVSHLRDALSETGPGDSDLDLPCVLLDLDAAR
ncbi:MAG: NAD(P)H-hydrate dehydratase [Gemmatimonadetes bacterium]|nr:NAD(P)H-hydrate dehydratase [Gemmatimonadota bacterium]